MNEIFRFTYNDIEYRVIKNEYSYIPLKMIDGKEVYKLNQDELDIVSQVFKKIKLTNDRVKLPNYRYLDKEYEHFYDKVNHYHIFLNLDGSSLSENEFIRLNMLFNYQSDIMYNGSIKESKLKRLVKIGKKIVLVLVISSSFIGVTDNLIGVSAKEIKIEKKEELSSYQKIENLIKSINSNKNLSKEEKKFILNSYKDVIYDNIDLIDYDSVKEKFETLDINYIKESNESIKGEYDIIGNYINIYNFSKDSFNKKTMEHELFHVLQGDCLDPGLYEPLNNIFVNEYIGKKETNKNRTYEDGYTYITKYMYVLMEIVNPEALRYYNFTGDDSKLKEELMSIIDDESIYYDLISYYNLARYGNSIENVTMSNICIKIEELLNKYYTTKYNESMYTNIEVIETLYSDSIYKFLKSDIDINEKVYLNNYYKDKNKNTKIKYSKDNKSISTKKLVKDKEFQKLVKEEKNNLFKNGYDYSEIVYGNIKITSNNDTLNITDNETTYSLNSMYSRKIINIINNEYFDYINSFSENKKDVLIECNIYDSKASIIINSNERKVFNIDLNTGEEVSLDKIIGDLGITKEDILNSVLEYFSSYESKDKIKSDMERFVKEGYKTYYIDKNGNLCFDSVCNNKDGLNLKKITTDFSYLKDRNIKK